MATLREALTGALLDAPEFNIPQHVYEGEGGVYFVSTSIFHTPSTKHILTVTPREPTVDQLTLSPNQLRRLLHLFPQAR
jgi:hypothetical protein